MNVLMLTDKLTTGGAEIYFCKLENELNHPSLQLFSAASEGELFEKIKNKKNFLLLSKRNHLFNLLKLKRFIKRNNITIFHANSLRMVLYTSILNFFKWKKSNVIYTKHNVTFLEKWTPVVFQLLLNHFVDSVITVSNYEKDNLIELGVNKNKITTIYNGVDLQQFLYKKKKKNNFFHIGILARLSEEKNHEFFIQIAHKLRNYENYKFFIGGDGPELDKIMKRIHALELNDKITMLGQIHQPEEFVNNMDVLLLTSHREVFPMVVIEAMAVGTPMISINKGGIKEAVINNQTGCLIENHSVEEFCNKIITIEMNDSLKSQLILGAQQLVNKKFSLQNMIQQTLNQYLKYEKQR
ncbi:glycosyltransferase family 4 protein [Evansella sp. AB-P1]|uniref:glycosyltransferase family 4 protein n=1 Tax=Evansella sp. AB-P1 TaxID=3037653 RepID=UPI00241C295D|nr:glycosyltransferase family 4 protein [Evansella sp. AB-P1]MDG5787888.1 glycosyltransferase family 4 protein [Evansella sp. AB-P1]